MDTVVEFAVHQLTRYQSICLNDCFAQIQSEPCLARFLVRAMTGKAFAGQNGTYLPVEINRFCRGL